MKGFTTQVVHHDRLQGVEHGSVHKPVHTSVAFGYESSRELAAVFQGKQAGYTYGRQINPTVEALENKISRMEGGLRSVCFGTGMAAIGTTLFSLLRQGDHVVSSQFLFGNTNSLMNTFDAQGIKVSFADATSVEAVESAICEDTKLVFVETIANPRTQVSALREIGELCARRNLIYVVDNTMTSPYLFQPVEVGASLIINSLTKYIGGHGNALGGVVTETGNFDWSGFANIYETYRSGDPRFWGITQIKKKGLRDFGAAMSAETAHHIAIGAETLALRMERQCQNAQALATFLDAHTKVGRVYYPGLETHPQYQASRELFKYPGAILGFELVPEVDVWACLDRLQLAIKSTNLGDNRTLVIPVAHTIYHEMGAERRASMGIDDNLVRVSLGIEDVEDVLSDFSEALAAS